MPPPPAPRAEDRHRAGRAVDRDRRALLQAGPRAGQPDDGGHPRLAGEDREVREHAAGLGDEAVQPRQDRRDPAVERRHDEDRALGGVGRVAEEDRSLVATAARAGALVRVAVEHRDRAAEVGQAEPGRERLVRRRALVEPVADRDREVAHDQLERLEVEATDLLGLVERAVGGEPAAQLPREAGLELLHPADPEPQRLPHRGRAVVGAGRPLGRLDAGGQLGRRADARRHQREHLGVPGRDLVVGDAVLPGERERAQRNRRAGELRRRRVEHEPDEHLVRMQRDERVAGPLERRDELAVGEVGRCGHVEQQVVGLVDDVDADRRERGAQPADAPGGADGPHPRRDLVPARLPARLEQVEVDRDPPVHHDRERRAIQHRGPDHAEDLEDRPDRAPQRRDPQVLLEAGERIRERLGDRAGAEHGTLGHARRRRGDRTRLQQPQRAVVVDRPLDVLRPAEDARRLVTEARAARAGRDGTA